MHASPGNGPYKNLLLFYALTYGLSWLCWAPYYLPFFGNVWKTAPSLHLIGTLGPGCAALIKASWERGAIGVRSQLAIIFLKGRWRYALLGLVLPFAIAMLVQAVAGQGLGNSFTVDPAVYEREFGAIHPALWMIGINLAIYGLGEESGWRGYALPLLQQRWSPLTAAILIALFWAVWHWPLFFYPLSGYYSMGAGDVAGWVFSLIAGSLILSWLFNKSGGNVVACVFFHGAMDIAFAGGKGGATMQQYVGAIVMLLGIVAAVSLYRSHRKQQLKPTIAALSH